MQHDMVGYSSFVVVVAVVVVAVAVVVVAVCCCCCFVVVCNVHRQSPSKTTVPTRADQLKSHPKPSAISNYFSLLIRSTRND